MLLIGMLGAFGGNPAQAGVVLTRQNPASFTTEQWYGTFAIANQLPLASRIALWADLVAVDSQYSGDPLGEGPGNLPDPDPLCDFTRVDCVTYVEQVYALALSTSRAQFNDTLRRIRYRDGQVEYRWRNHYTVSDWLPANAWFIRDLTAEIGVKHTQSMTKTIARRTFFTDKGLPQYADIPDEIATTSYIPREQIDTIAGKVKTGDLAVFVISSPGIIAGHVGLIRVTNGVAYLQHASLTEKRVVTRPLAEYVQALPARFLGLKLARPTEPTVPATVKADSRG